MRRHHQEVHVIDDLIGWLGWLLPFKALAAANWAAMYATRYMHETGMTRQHLGLQAISQRNNALLNPRAVVQKPLSMEDYLDARVISSPLCLFDCDIPVDGACVIIVSAIDAARDLRQVPIAIEAFGAGMRAQESWDQWSDMTTMGAHDAAADMWSRTDIKPNDVDIAAVYDGFSIFVPLWLEAFGFCGHGEAADFIAGGNNRLSGSLPVNTGGGQLSAGRLHGFGLLHEACTQLWGLGDKRQVASAKTAVCGMGGGPLAGAMILKVTNY